MNDIELVSNIRIVMCYVLGLVHNSNYSMIIHNELNENMEEKLHEKKESSFVGISGKLDFDAIADEKDSFELYRKSSLAK